VGPVIQYFGESGMGMIPATLENRRPPAHQDALREKRRCSHVCLLIPDDLLDALIVRPAAARHVREGFPQQHLAHRLLRSMPNAADAWSKAAEARHVCEQEPSRSWRPRADLPPIPVDEQRRLGAALNIGERLAGQHAGEIIDGPAASSTFGCD
jgi:hypothetical protein